MLQIGSLLGLVCTFCMCRFNRVREVRFLLHGSHRNSSLAPLPANRPGGRTRHTGVTTFVGFWRSKRRGHRTSGRVDIRPKGWGGGDGKKGGAGEAVQIDREKESERTSSPCFSTLRHFIFFSIFFSSRDLVGLAIVHHHSTLLHPPSINRHHHSCRSWENIVRPCVLFLSFSFRLYLPLFYFAPY